MKKLLTGICILSLCACSAIDTKMISSNISDGDGDGDGVTFVVVADMPYDEQESALLDGVITANIQNVVHPELVFHLGDFKEGSSDCTETLFLQRKQQIDNLLPGRVVYTPGDNDWTDCDRERLSNPYSELQALAFLKAHFFADDHLPESWRVEPQPMQQENKIWRIGNVYFGSFHVVGTNNGRDEILLDDPAEAIALVESREQNNIAWLEQLFAMAMNNDSEAVIVGAQADLYNPYYIDKYQGDCWQPGLSLQQKTRCDGLGLFRTRLAELADAYKKPVLFIHGDTFQYCLQRPVAGLDNFWRLNAGGDFKVKDVVVIKIHPEQTESPFLASGLLSGETPPLLCDQVWDES